MRCFGVSDLSWPYSFQAQANTLRGQAKYISTSTSSSRRSSRSNSSSSKVVATKTTLTGISCKMPGSSVLDLTTTSSRGPLRVFRTCRKALGAYHKLARPLQAYHGHYATRSCARAHTHTLSVHVGLKLFQWACKYVCNE